jgi:uncharacterized protein YciI
VPHFIAICRDRAGSLELRKATRPSHLNYLETLGAAVAVGGPIISDRRPVGSIIVLEASDQAAAAAILRMIPTLSPASSSRSRWLNGRLLWDQ